MMRVFSPGQEVTLRSKVMLPALVICLLLVAGAVSGQSGSPEGTDAAPTLVFPPQNQTNVDMPVLFRWLSDKSDGYNLQVSWDQKFEKLVLDYDTAFVFPSDQGNYLAQSLQPSTIYYWRVRSRISGTFLWTEFSQIFRFSTIADFTPTLISPENGATDVLQPTTLRWSVIDTATQYQVQVDQSSKFDSPEVDFVSKVYSYPMADWHVVDHLVRGETYYWRVRVRAGNWQPYSQPSSFTTACPVPLAPALESPTSGADVSRPVQLIWRLNPEGEVAHHWEVRIYHYEVETPVVDTVLLTSDTTVYVIGLQDATRYFWNVRSGNDCGFGSWYPKDYYFDTEGCQFPGPPTHIYPPPMSEGVAPGAPEDSIPLPVTFEWSAIPGAIQYQLQVSEDWYFEVPLIDVVSYPTTYAAAGLTPNTDYWWRIRTYNECGWGYWSYGSWFRTSETCTTLSSPTVVSPIADQIFHELPVKIQWQPLTAAEHYYLQVDDSPDFQSPLAAQVTTSLDSAMLHSLNWDKEYFCRVRADNYCGAGSYSEIIRFELAHQADCILQTDIPEVSLVVRDQCQLPETVALGLSWDCDRWIPIEVIAPEWLEISVDSMSVQSVQLLLTVNEAHPTIGNYHEQLQIMSAHALNSPFEIPVLLEVRPNDIPSAIWQTTNATTADTVHTAPSDNLLVELVGSDADSDSLVFRSLGPLPAGSQLRPTGRTEAEFVWVEIDECSGVHQVLLEISDGCDADTLNFVLSISNQAPEFAAACGEAWINERQRWSCEIHATDPDGTPCELTWSSIPERATCSDLGGGSAQLEFEPGYQDVDDSFLVVFTAEDGCESSTDTVTIHVQNQQLIADQTTGMHHVLISDKPLAVQFNEAIRKSTIESSFSYVSARDDRLRYTYESQNYRLTFDNATTYLRQFDTIVVSLSTGLIDSAGYPLNQAYIDTFCTGVAVYPGDANADGQVDERDVFPLGFYWGELGPSRPNSDLNWRLQPAYVTGPSLSWRYPVAAFADADGNGTVAEDDICAIIQNWHLQHQLPLTDQSKIDNARPMSLDDRPGIISALYQAALDCPDGPGKMPLIVQLQAIGQLETSLPTEYRLNQAYPNPFNDRAVIEYALPADGHVRLDIYNVLGRRVTTLVDLHQVAGRHSIAWDGTGDQGQVVSSGVYFYRLEVAQRSLSRSMVLLK